jgi:hypothetical protein
MKTEENNNQEKKRNGKRRRGTSIYILGVFSFNVGVPACHLILLIFY